MPLFSTEALILRTYKLGEADRIAVFLTRDRGKKRGVARGARRSRSRFLGALEPLTHVRVAYFERERRDLVSLNYAETVSSPLAARQPEALDYVGYFAELIDEWAPEADPNERLFRLGTSVAEALATDVDPGRLARYFEFWLLRLQGVYPSFTACPGCGGDLSRGAGLAPQGRVYECARCLPGPDATRLSAGALQFLRTVGRLGPLSLADLAVTPDALAELEIAHRWLTIVHLEREPRSIRVLRDVRPRGVPA